MRHADEHLVMTDRVAVVTGVSRRAGIGFAVARRLAEEGAALVVQSWAAHDVEMPWGGDAEGPEALVAELRSMGSDVVHIVADFEQPAAAGEVIAAGVAEFGHVDVVVANHARSSSQGIDGLTAYELDRTLAVNVRGTLLLVQAFAAQHDGRAGGRVVLFTSGQGKGPMPGEVPYVASKGAIEQVTPTLAAELMARNITVNAVDPGPTETGWADAATRSAVEGLMPRGRWGTPDDAARLVSWLAGPDADWVTGQVIHSDGGFPSS